MALTRKNMLTHADVMKVFEKNPPVEWPVKEKKMDPINDVKEWKPYARFGFTVVQNKPGGNSSTEIRYDADRIEAVFRDGDSEPMISFVSSGRRMQIPAIEVDRIEMTNPRKLPEGYLGTTHCSGCDNQFTHMMKAKPV